MDFSPHNEHLLMTSDNEELVFWDLRNTAKRLLNIKVTGLSKVEFCNSRGDLLIVSKDQDIEMLDLKKFKAEASSEKHCIDVV
jgi:hypothetical protein